MTTGRKSRSKFASLFDICEGRDVKAESILELTQRQARKNQINKNKKATATANQQLQISLLLSSLKYYIMQFIIQGL